MADFVQEVLPSILPEFLGAALLQISAALSRRLIACHPPHHFFFSFPKRIDAEQTPLSLP